MASAPIVHGSQWTGTEIRELRERYPSGGAKAAATALPGRSIRSIYMAAHQLGIKRAGQRPGRGRRS